MTMKNPEFMTISEVAELFRVTKMTVLRMIARGNLPAVRIEKQYRVHPQDVQDYLTSHKQ